MSKIYTIVCPACEGSGYQKKYIEGGGIYDDCNTCSGVGNVDLETLCDQYAEPLKVLDDVIELLKREVQRIVREREDRRGGISSYDNTFQE